MCLFGYVMKGMTVTMYIILAWLNKLLLICFCKQEGKLGVEIEFHPKGVDGTRGAVHEEFQDFRYNLLEESYTAQHRCTMGMPLRRSKV